MNDLVRRMINGDELFHHGIKNMHWGVRNGPPYPLDSKVSKRIKSGHNKKVRVSAKEYQEMRSGKIKTGKKEKVGRTHLMVGFKGQTTNEHHFRETNDFTGFSEMREQGLSGLILDNVASVIGKGHGDWIRRLKRPGHKATYDDVLDCNFWRQNSDSPYNGRNDRGLNNNCGKCSATMFLRGLGYDVQAARSGTGVLPSAFQYWFDGAKAYKETGARNMYERMSSFGNQGKGVLTIRHANGSGHAVYFQNERDHDGKTRPMIYDGQIAKKYGSLSDFLKRECVDIGQSAEITRLDGSTPNWDHLAEDSVCRMSFRDHQRNFVSNVRTGEKWLADHFYYS